VVVVDPGMGCLSCGCTVGRVQVVVGSLRVDLRVDNVALVGKTSLLRLTCEREEVETD
jgi:hypothetical protein